MKDLKKWIEPVQKTIEKYEALRNFIKTREYNSILRENCFLCELAVKKSSELRDYGKRCKYCIHWYINQKDCGYKKRQSSFWVAKSVSLTGLINEAGRNNIDTTTNYIVKGGVATQNELLRKIGIRIGIHKRILKKIGGLSL